MGAESDERRSIREPWGCMKEVTVPVPSPRSSEGRVGIPLNSPPQGNPSRSLSSGEAAGWLRWPLVTSVSLSIPIPSPGDSADVRVVFWMEGKSGILGENPDPAPFAV